MIKNIFEGEKHLNFKSEEKRMIDERRKKERE
jgi:hypothetical protein